jgi:lysyl-tRNA synthetase class II
VASAEAESTGRREAILRLKSQGRQVYKAKYFVTDVASEARALPDEPPLSVAGRVMLLRTFGGRIFGHI